VGKEQELREVYRYKFEGDSPRVFPSLGVTLKPGEEFDYPVKLDLTSTPLLSLVTAPTQDKTSAETEKSDTTSKESK
jgi:hypothetical protein